MDRTTALRVALDVYRVPSRIRSARAEALPSNVTQVLLVAAGDEEAGREASAELQRPVEEVRAAAAFFIEQVLLSPEADSYRVLGANRHATAAELRRNMALLLRWLHPDLDPGGERSMFVGRVLGSWEELKTPERRSSYDGARKGGLSGSAQQRSTQKSSSAPRRSARGRYAQSVPAPLFGRMLAFFRGGKA